MVEIRYLLKDSDGNETFTIYTYSKFERKYLEEVAVRYHVALGGFVDGYRGEFRFAGPTKLLLPFRKSFAFLEPVLLDLDPAVVVKNTTDIDEKEKVGDHPGVWLYRDPTWFNRRLALIQRRALFERIDWSMMHGHNDIMQFEGPLGKLNALHGWVHHRFNCAPYY